MKAWFLGNTDWIIGKNVPRGISLLNFISECLGHLVGKKEVVVFFGWNRLTIGVWSFFGFLRWFLGPLIARFAKRWNKGLSIHLIWRSEVHWVEGHELGYGDVLPFDVWKWRLGEFEKFAILFLASISSNYMKKTRFWRLLVWEWGYYRSCQELLDFGLVVERRALRQKGSLIPTFVWPNVVLMGLEWILWKISEVGIVDLHVSWKTCCTLPNSRGRLGTGTESDKAQTTGRLIFGIQRDLAKNSENYRDQWFLLFDFHRRWSRCLVGH